MWEVGIFASDVGAGVDAWVGAAIVELVAVAIAQWEGVVVDSRLVKAFLCAAVQVAQEAIGASRADGRGCAADEKAELGPLHLIATGLAGCA